MFYHQKALDLYYAEIKFLLRLRKIHKMTDKKEETASFVLRLSQKIYNNDDGEAQVQWRGNIRHVQTGEEKRFLNFEDATAFVQNKLSDLTLKAVEDKPVEEQKGIISKSFDFWKQVAAVTPKLVLDSIKDPKKQASQFQEQLQEQFAQISENIGQKIEDKIGQKIELDDILGSSKSDSRKIMAMLGLMAEQIEALDKKIDLLKSEKPKKGK